MAPGSALQRAQGHKGKLRLEEGEDAGTSPHLWEGWEGASTGEKEAWGGEGLGQGPRGLRGGEERYGLECFVVLLFVRERKDFGHFGEKNK